MSNDTQTIPAADALLRDALGHLKAACASAGGDHIEFMDQRAVAHREFHNACVEHLSAALDALDASRAATAQDASALHAIAMNVRCDTGGISPLREGAFRLGHKQARHDIAEAIVGHFAERIASFEAKPTTDAWKARAERAEALLGQGSNGIQHRVAVSDTIFIDPVFGAGWEVLICDSTGFWRRAKQGLESPAAALAWLDSPHGIAAVDTAGKAGGK